MEFQSGVSKVRGACPSITNGMALNIKILKIYLFHAQVFFKDPSVFGCIHNFLATITPTVPPVPGTVLAQ